MNYSDIRSAVIRPIREHIGLPLIELNTIGEMPKESFFTYSFSNWETKGTPMRVDDCIYENIEFSIVFMSYAKTKAESVDNAMKVRDWLFGDGHMVLKNSLDIVVVDVGVVTEQDVLTGTEWERRNVFEVEFRTIRQIVVSTDVIEKIQLNGGNIIE